jgi:hypothetical protein
VSYIRIALARNGPGKEERLVSFVAPDEFHATFTLTDRCSRPMLEAAARERLAELASRGRD